MRTGQFPANAQTTDQNLCRWISDSAKGEFEAVIVWKIDRFSRDKYDNTVYKSKLNKNGVSVISATNPYGN